MNSNKKNKMNSVSNYNGNQKILLVGEGDFSFSLCLAKSFGSATNMIATSLDSREEVKRKYMNGKANLEELERLGCTLVHGVNVHSLTADLSHLGWTLYDRIIFNFPHAGFHFGRESDSFVISEHQEVVRVFLKNAKKMLKSLSGQIHVTHKTAHPFNNWEIKTLAREEVNVHSMIANIGLRGWTLYDIIIFNFPHAGFHFGRERDSFVISEHQKVVRGFLKNAKKMVKCSSGEIHVTHKTGYPFNEWVIKTLAEEVELFAIFISRLFQQKRKWD